ncbi:MAG: TVP38/TMEM64 family protein [Clostridiales bacterium]|jgi:uncharacterized membrane protein YdjX (TVP38/TMEM64 family)|nr:TVP38/TMEM64 family protein [Clostridiales bacterium]
MAENEKKKGGLLKIIIAVLVIGAVIAVAYITDVIRFLNPQYENSLIVLMEQWQADLGGLVFLLYLGYIVLYVIAAVFMLPALIFTIAAGMVFGPVFGAILALLGATVGAAAAFIVARFVARDSIENRFGSSALFKKIDDGIKQNGVSFLILTRLVPIFPYNVQNYIYGLTPIKFGTFVIVSLITMAPGAFIYAFMAGIIVHEGISFQLLLYFAGAGIILFLVSLIPKYIAKKKGINLNEDKE